MRTIRVTANRQKRTFTIRIYRDGQFEFKYRTISFCCEEFNSMEYNTQEDWQYFLNHTYNYYRVYNRRIGK